METAAVHLRILDLPMWLFAILFIGGFVAVSLALTVALRPFVRKRYADEHNAVLDTGFSAAGSMYAIVAGLLVFGVYSTFEQAQGASASEASNLVLMYKQAAVFPQPYRDQAQDAVVSYTRSVIDDDWPALGRSEASPKTTAALDHMFSVWEPIVPSGEWSDQYSASLDELNEVFKLRNERVDASRSALAPIYWLLLYVGAAITIVHLVLLQMENRTMHLLAVGLTTAMLASVLFLLVEVNRPFRGELSLSPDSFRSALAVFTTDHGR